MFRKTTRITDIAFVGEVCFLTGIRIASADRRAERLECRLDDIDGLGVSTAL
jgi:hypothetical protein